MQGAAPSTPLCIVCSRFFGSPATRSMCSACYRQSLQQAIGAVQKPAAVSSSSIVPFSESEERKSSEVAPAATATTVEQKQSQPQQVAAHTSKQ